MKTYLKLEWEKHKEYYRQIGLFYLTLFINLSGNRFQDKLGQLCTGGI